MFFHQEILRRKGLFGTVWLAATLKDEQIKRREVSKVDLIKSCDDILDFILVRRQPSAPGRSRPRFSLYLSSMLMFGCARIYKKQAQYLLDDINSFLIKVRIAANISENIDLNVICRPDLVTMPDMVLLSLDSQPCYDPYFGRILIDKDREEFQTILAEMSSPGSSSGSIKSGRSKGSVASVTLETASLERSAGNISMETGRLPTDREEKSFAEAVKAALGSPHTVSSLDQITLKEMDIPLQQMPEQTELPPLDDQMLQSLAEQPSFREMDLITDGMQPKVSQAFVSLASPIKVTDIQEDRNLSPKEKTPRTHIGEGLPEPPPVHRENGPRSPDITVNTEERQRTRKRREKIDVEMELSPIPERTRKRRKIRHLVIDEDMVISKANLKKNLQTGSELCVPFQIPVVGKSDVVTLFNRPSSRSLQSKPLIDLWRHNQRLGIMETDSDMETPFWSLPDLTVDTPAAKKSRRSKRALHPEEGLSAVPQQEELNLPQTELQPDLPQVQPDVIQADSMPPLEQEKQRAAETSVVDNYPDVSSIELGRDASVLMEKSLHDATPVSLHLSGAHDRSRDDSSTRSSKKRQRRSRVSLEEDLSIPAPSKEPSILDASRSENLSIVQEEPEIPQAILPGTLERSQTIPQQTAEKSQEDGRSLLRLIKSKTSRSDCTSFAEIFPPTSTDRKTAAAMFGALLNLSAKRKVHVDQVDPYGDIYIWRN